MATEDVFQFARRYMAVLCSTPEVIVSERACL